MNQGHPTTDIEQSITRNDNIVYQGLDVGGLGNVDEGEGALRGNGVCKVSVSCVCPAVRLLKTINSRTQALGDTCALHSNPVTEAINKPNSLA